LFIDIESAKHNFNIIDCHSKFFCQESNHMICCFARHWRGSDTNFELIAFDLANSIFFCAGFAENIKH